MASSCAADDTAQALESELRDNLPNVPRLEAPAGANAGWLARTLGRAAESGVPLVIGLSANSSLLPEWTPAALIDRVPILTRAYVGGASRFGPYYDENRPMALAGIGLAPSHGFTETSLRTHDLFAAPASASSHSYYSGEVERDLPASMLDELRPLESALIARNPSHASVNLWLGSRPVSAPCHYDAYHNAAAQLSGSKRWVLAPPSAWDVVRVFPFLHPSHAQCQVSLFDIDSVALARAGGSVAQLERGDILYLPPLYFHETLALSVDGVVGVNGWVGCDESDAASRLFAVPRPSRHSTDESDDGGGASAAAALVALLSRHALGDGSALAARLWSERYASLGHLTAHDLVPTPVVAAGCARLLLAHAWGGGVEGASGVDLSHQFRHTAAKWASLAAGVARTGFSEATRGTWVANLAELAVAERVGIKGAASFWRRLHECKRR